MSLYKLKKHKHDIADIEGFGTTKAKKIVAEVENKRRLYDYVFFGAIGIDGVSNKTFESIFNLVKLSEFLDMVKLKNFTLLRSKLMTVNGVGDTTADTIIDRLKDKKFISEINSILKEVILYQSYGGTAYTNGRVTFTGCRPDDEITDKIHAHGMDASDSWSDKLTKILVVPNAEYTSSKVNTAVQKNIPIIPLGELENYLNQMNY